MVQLMGRVRLIPVFSLLAILSAAPAASAEAPPAPAPAQNLPATTLIKEGELLDMTRCVEIAIRVQPGILAARSAVGVSQSRIGQAQSAYYPQVDLSAGYTRTSPVPSSNRAATGGGQAFNFYSNSVTLSQNIYSFGKTTSEVRIQELNTDSSRADLENTVTQTVFNVKQAYYSLLQSKRNLEVAADTVKQFELHLEQSKGFFEAGVKPKFDVTKAEADLANSRVNLIKAENALRLARVSLNNAMGVTGAPNYEIVDNLTDAPYGITMDEAMKRAFEQRPDVRSAEARRKAAEENINLSGKGYYPSINGTAAYNQAGEKYPLEDGWSVGASISLPIFSGFLTKYQVREARASLDVAGANEEALKQSVFFEVQQAYLNLKEAEERIPAAKLSLKQATENLDIANGRYSAGVGSPIEVTDAEVLVINARTAYIQALTDYGTAHASLEKAMGSR